MNYSFLALTLLAVFGFSGAAVAAPVGNPAQLQTDEEQTFKVGYEGEYVVERELKRGELEDGQSHAVKMAYGVGPGEVYGLLGATEFEVNQTANTHYNTDYGFLYGGGARAQLWNNLEGTAIGVDGRYRRSEPDVDEAMIGGTSVTRSDVTYQDWQVALGISQEIGNVVPYGGVKYSDVDISDVSGFADAESDHVIGPFAGVTAMATENLAFNIEGHYYDETSVTGGVTWQY